MTPKTRVFRVPKHLFLGPPKHPFWALMHIMALTELHGPIRPLNPPLNGTPKSPLSDPNKGPKWTPKTRVFGPQIRDLQPKTPLNPPLNDALNDPFWGHFDPQNTCFRTPKTPLLGPKPLPQKGPKGSQLPPGSTALRATYTQKGP